MATGSQSLQQRLLDMVEQERDDNRRAIEVPGAQDLKLSLHHITAMNTLARIIIAARLAGASQRVSTP